MKGRDTIMSLLKTQLDQEAKRIHPIASGLYASCQANRDHYRELDMKIEAHVFDAYMKRIEDKFGILSSLTLTSGKVHAATEPSREM